MKANNDFKKRSPKLSQFSKRNLSCSEPEVMTVSEFTIIQLTMQNPKIGYFLFLLQARSNQTYHGVSYFSRVGDVYWAKLGDIR